MNRAALIAAWLEPSIENLAVLMGEDAAGVEYAIRHELLKMKLDNEIQPAEAEPPADVVALPAPPKAPKAGASSPRPARRNHAAEMAASPVRKRIAATMNSALDLTGYPESLQDPRATSQRAVLDALKSGPMTLGQVAEATGLESSKAWATLGALRQKNLVIGSEDTPVVWRLANG